MVHLIRGGRHHSDASPLVKRGSVRARPRPGRLPASSAKAQEARSFSRLPQTRVHPSQVGEGALVLRVPWKEPKPSGQGAQTRTA